LYEGVNVANLSNREIADAKFHQGYSYFTMQQFAQAKPLFNTIRQIKKDSNYIDANYYYGFIAFRDRNYDEALKSFRIVEKSHLRKHRAVLHCPDLLCAGKRGGSAGVCRSKNESGKTQYYDLELKKLLGHGFFMQKQYAKPFRTSKIM
jgi:tetratricopeptide (TPR) repeat protein